MISATVMNMVAFCSFVTALILGLVAYVGSRNAPWAKLNTDGQTVVIGSAMCAVVGVIALVISVLEFLQIIPIVVL